MYTPTILTSLLLTLPLALARPLDPRAIHEFSITSLSATLPIDGPQGTGPIDSNIGITVAYPDAASTSGANSSTTCSFAWPASTPPGPTDWTPCVDTALEWRLPANGWTSQRNYRVEIYQTLTSDGAGLSATHNLKMNPGQSTDPDAYLSCIQMGKFTPDRCQLNGPLSARPGPVIMSAVEESARPS
ncbi:hypothetical protein K504DRAFT_5167 [Pleomassaria siparia CBS 279.74]|uniref:Ubiquitin 3 binding protein But2 C-terminal domain-containing protein n=1 Tax=Pleomassaria siparia CBS 279.74 TaxID=1314801 RepID=A0A6G1KNT3_9PLEO|nr:hypothetical protein K504DRAFT_5167 [Pleomassaria siparia CBS 279.74]